MAYVKLYLKIKKNEIYTYKSVIIMKNEDYIHVTRTLIFQSILIKSRVYRVSTLADKKKVTITITNLSSVTYKEQTIFIQDLAN